MLKKINKIKGLGLVFNDFAWQPGVPDFKPVNLIYGWNGCGKTTLTRLFDIIAAGTAANVEFEVEDDLGAIFSAGMEFPRPIRVFNHEYVNNNVRILESRTSTISILLGEENTDLAARIDIDERLLRGDPSQPDSKGLVAEFNNLDQKRKRKEKENETAFTSIAREISATAMGTGFASRSYRSPQAKAGFAALTGPQLLDEAELGRCSLAIKQEMLSELTMLASDATQAIEKSLQDALSEGQALCSATVDAEVISRLVSKPDVSEWIEEGLRIHAAHDSEACEYCGNHIGADRAAQLARHFSDADRQLKARIDDFLARLREIYAAISGTTNSDAARLYNELRGEFEKAVATFDIEKAALLSAINNVGQLLKEKKSKTTEVFAADFSIDPQPFLVALTAIDAIIGVHNQKTRKFRAVQEEAVAKIQTHFLSTIFAEVTERKTVIEELAPELERRSSEIAEIRERVRKSRAAISSSHKACEEINNSLKAFLGRSEIQFEPDVSDGDGETSISAYRIMRGREAATHLSEGEKTAIAFVYFVVHLNDGQFSKSNGIVVVDDPISSLDSNSMYQAFSFLKNAVLDCKQVFILTHNFDFLKLLLNWRSQRRERHTSYFMILNRVVDGARQASIGKMDRELKDYASEYHYLFKRLKEMRAAQDGSIMQAYPVPNIARKVWDSFLMFRVPNGQGPYQQLEELKRAGFDSQKLDAIHKFVNDNSHITGGGFDPALVPETQNTLAHIFDMMRTIAPEHYDVLDRATS